MTRARMFASAFALTAVALAGCRNQGAVTTRIVTMHAPAACGAGGFELDGGAYATYSALGDFDPESPGPPGYFLGNLGVVLPAIDSACRTLVVGAMQRDTAWAGLSEIPALGDLDVLLLPTKRSCAFAPMFARPGAVLTPLAHQTVLLVGGVADASGSPFPTYVTHLDTGTTSLAVPDLLTPRLGASVTAFGPGALVAGGIDPRSGGSTLDSAEVYSIASGGFAQQNRIFLSAPRAYPGSVQLVTGETLLVGGAGGPSASTVLDSMEIVDPATLTVRAENIARLSVARRSPEVLRLASGEVLVAGGLDASGNAVSTLEWFSPDATTATKRASALVSGAAHAYIALESGGALAVITPPPSADASFRNVWVIGADGALQAAVPIDGSLTQPVLFGGAGGAPVLWTGDRWLRFQPWSGTFVALGALDDVPAAVGMATASPDPGLALWLDPNSSVVTAMRFDSRGEYSPLVGPLWLTSADDTAPDGLVGSGGATFDASTGLILASGASAFVTDRTYADVDVDLDAPTGEPAWVVFRDELGNELEVGGPACPAALSAGSGAPSTFHVERVGSVVTWKRGSSVSGTCAVMLSPGARIAIGVRAQSGGLRSVASNLRIARLGAR